MTERKLKLSKRSYPTAEISGKSNPTRSLSGDGDIFTVYQYFQLRQKHLKNSNRPDGWFHSTWGGSEQTVEIRWLWTERQSYFAPEIRFRPSTAGVKLSAKIAKALYGQRNTSDEGPDRLMADLGAYLVEFVNDKKEGCWDDYRVLQAPNEPAMMTIARYAASAE